MVDVGPDDERCPNCGVGGDWYREGDDDTVTCKHCGEVFGEDDPPAGQTVEGAMQQGLPESIALAQYGQGEPAPIPMILHCPECRARHIDRGKFATKPHHTHSCQMCGLTWRPAVVPTVGVQFLPGFKDEIEDDSHALIQEYLAFANHNVEQRDEIAIALRDGARDVWEKHPYRDGANIVAVIAREVCRERKDLRAEVARLGRRRRGVIRRLLDELRTEAKVVPLGDAFDGGPLDGASTFNVYEWAAAWLERRMERPRS